MHLAFSALALFALASACRSSREWDAEPLPPHPTRGMVVAEHELAAKIGVDILNDGGNAVDAAVATALALAVVYPEAGNLGGGGFALVVPEIGEPRALDFREVAPASTSLALYTDDRGRIVAERSLRGPLSVGVPGSPAGLWELEQTLGSKKFSFAELALPAIRLARDGFVVDARLARDLANPALRQRFGDDATANTIFYPNGVALREGERLRQPALADTLERLATDGPSAFYSGVNAARIVRALRLAAKSSDDRGDVPGTVSLDDLAHYQIEWREPLRGWFRGLEVISMPPPSSGGIILLETLGVLDGFPIDSERRRALAEHSATGRATCDSLGLDDRILHWWIEALRRAFVERATHLGDPKFTPVPLRELISADWIARTRVGIGEQATPDIASAVEPPHEGSNTTHLSVLDAQGNAVSLTTTLNSTFGSGTMVEDAGFILNDELDDFAFGSAANQFGLVGGEANALAPGKRPLSTMTPTIVRQSDRRVVLVIGSPGGPRIVTAVIGVMLRTLMLGQSLADAVRAPRFHQQWSPTSTDFESGWPAEVLGGLERRGHVLKRDVAPWGSVQAIRVGDDGEPEGATDPRNPGAALASRRGD